MTKLGSLLPSLDEEDKVPTTEIGGSPDNRWYLVLGGRGQREGA